MADSTSIAFAPVPRAGYCILAPSNSTPPTQSSTRNAIAAAAVTSSHDAATRSLTGATAGSCSGSG
jgi:hypothetical protein